MSPAMSTLEQRRRYRERDKAKGICVATGCKTKAKNGHTLCSADLKRMREYTARMRKERETQGLCIQCGQLSELGQRRCLTCSSPYRTGLPQPIRKALTQYRKQQEQTARDAVAQQQRDFIERHLFLIKNPRTQEILRLRYGATEAGRMTLQQVGERVGVTRARVDQILKYAEERICMFTIEKDIPIPHGKRTGQYEELRQTLMQMETGDSFTFPSRQFKNSLLSSLAKSLGYIVTTRKVSDTERRVWLVSKNGTQDSNTAKPAQSSPID